MIQVISKVDTGTATIPAGDTFVDVTHELGAAPGDVLFSEKELEGNIQWWDTPTATTFRINIGAAQLIDTNFTWRAEL